MHDEQFATDTRAIGHAVDIDLTELGIDPTGRNRVAAVTLLIQPRCQGRRTRCMMSVTVGITAAALQEMIASGFVKAVHAGLASAERAVDDMAERSGV